MVRRRLEETEKAILDGMATLQICGRYGPEVLVKLPAVPQPVTPDDTCNSELVFLREDNELMPGDGFEIARGDEMTCWAQLELAVKDEAKGQPLEISLAEIKITRPGLGPTFPSTSVMVAALRQKDADLEALMTETAQRRKAIKLLLDQLNCGD